MIPAPATRTVFGGAEPSARALGAMARAGGAGAAREEERGEARRSRASVANQGAPKAAKGMRARQEEVGEMRNDYLGPAVLSGSAAGGGKSR